jgi:hypothetical protein
MIQFSGKIEVVGINPCIKVPLRVSRYFGKRGYVPVLVHLERGAVPSTLVPIGGGMHRLYINGAMLKYTDSVPGERISVGVEMDTTDRSLAMPNDIAEALASNALAQTRWHALTRSKQKEIIRYLSFAKHAETRARNLKKLLEFLGSKRGEGVLCGIQIINRTGSR